MDHKKEDLPGLLKQVDDKVAFMVLTEAHDAEGKPFYLYLHINPSKYIEYIEAHLKGAAIRFEDFGTVVRTGPGYPPPPEVAQEMQEKHGFNPNFEQEFAEEFVRQLEGAVGKFTYKAKQRKSKKYPYAKPPKDIKILKPNKKPDEE